MDLHLADCSTCHEVFAETLRFALDEEAEEALPRSSLVAIPFVRRPAFRLAAILAVAASVFLAFQQLWRARSERAAPPLIAELARAMGTKRFVEPRLTGGFQHGRLIVLRSDASQGLDAQSPAVLAAVARIRERTEGDTSPDGLGALAVTYLVSGDVSKAVKALESATAQAPKNPRLQSDLAAAYLVRASHLDEPADLPKALEAAEKAIELEDAPAEAWFNRALALESLHLVDSAKNAWEDFLKRDSTSAWADEARKHLEELPPAQQSTIEEDRARARAALAEGPTAIDRLADESPSILADYFLSELLPTWADAQLTGHPSALVLRTQAQQVGEALFRTTGDALPRDAALALASPPSGSSRDPPRTQALGYKSLQDSQRLHDLLQPSCEAFRESHHLLETGGSPYSAWARERIVVACYFPTDPGMGLAELSRIEELAEQHGYRRILGRVHWMEAFFHQHRGEFGASLDQYRRARDDFRAQHDPENEANVLVRIARVFQEGGESRSAWRERVQALALLDDVRQPVYRYALLDSVANACLHQRLTRAALSAQDALVVTARDGAIPALLGEALLWRSLSLHDLSLDDRAAEDVAEARRLIPKVGAATRAEYLSAQADAAEGRILAAREPERAAAALERALGYYQNVTPVWVPALRQLLARAQTVRGRDDAAEAELEAGIRLLQSQRASLPAAALQTSFFDQGASLFDEMVAFQIDRRNDPQRALLFVERGRARQLLDSLQAARTESRTGFESLRHEGPSPLGPVALQRELPAGTALVYYMCLADRLLSWVVTRKGIHFVGQAVQRDELRRSVAAYEAAMEGRAHLSVVREQAAGLYDRLLRPLTPHLDGQRTLILVPDETLQSVAFASLWDTQGGRWLIEDHFIGFAPSGSVFVRASSSARVAARDGALTLLSVGNPRFDRDRWAGLPNLPGAEGEAAEITRLYVHAILLTGREATKSEFIKAMRKSRVVHYAGHAVADDPDSAARLLLAPAAREGDSGALNLQDVDGSAFLRTRLVVLAACRTAAGGASRLEGAWSLARPFLAAGVPSVVASLWDIDDTVSRRFFVAFHSALLADGDALGALHRTQIAFQRDSDPALAHPATWAGFLAIGGTNLRRAHPTDSKVETQRQRL